jgi:hypothetical protein
MFRQRTRPTIAGGQQDIGCDLGYCSVEPIHWQLSAESIFPITQELTCELRLSQLPRHPPRNSCNQTQGLFLVRGGMCPGVKYGQLGCGTTHSGVSGGEMSCHKVFAPLRSSESVCGMWHNVCPWLAHVHSQIMYQMLLSGSTFSWTKRKPKLLSNGSRTFGVQALRFRFIRHGDHARSRSTSAP